MDERFTAAWAVLPDYLGHHVLLSTAALALGVLISLPLMVAASRSARLRWPVLAIASLVQTIPSLALLALFFPLLLALSHLSQRLLGHGFSALGFLPSLLALTLYSMLPILRNGTAAIMGVDRAVIEAARGVGMTDRQRLFGVELPLAFPLIMAGIRTAAVWVIGAATLSTPVGQTSLGNYIFSGLQTENSVSVLFGCIAAAVLAMTVDQLLGLVENGAATRRKTRVVVGLGLLLVGIAAALVPIVRRPQRPTCVIGAKTFSEQYTLAHVLEARLAKAGFAVSIKDDLGSTVAYRAVANGEIDVYVDYSGTLWTAVLGHRDLPPREQLLASLGEELLRRDGVTVLGALGFENAYAIAMGRDRAASLGIATLADLGRHAPDLNLGTDLEFQSRAEWKSIETAYALRFKSRKQYQPTFMYRAVQGGEADVISAFSSDGRIASQALVLLEDPKHALPPYDAVVLIAPRRANDTRFREALQSLIGRIDVETMREANLMVDRDREKATPMAAAEWLEAHLEAAKPGP